MATLVFNCGSSSLSYKVFQTPRGRPPQVVVAGKAHRVGVTGTAPAFVEHHAGGEVRRQETLIPDHRTAARLILEYLRATGVNVELVGHRFVHGGSLFNASAFLDRDTLRKLRSCLPLAPIHNPISLGVIHECRQSLPEVRQYVTFDSAFHCTIPDYAYTYALPRQIARRFGFRKYGFHGLSYWFVSRQVPGILNIPADRLKLVVCHLGTGGSSVAAIKGGRSVDTSMGYSPLPGLVMSTRSGDVDPMLMLYLMAVYGMRGDDLMDMLNRKSGLLGVSGFSSDLTDIIQRLDEDKFAGDNRDEQPLLAFRMYIQRVRKYVGGYIVALGGVDALVFTDDIGVRSWRVREEVCQGMEWCGIRLDAGRNRQGNPGATCLINAGDSRVSVLSIPSDEELAIYLQGQELLLTGALDAAV